MLVVCCYLSLFFDCCVLFVVDRLLFWLSVVGCFVVCCLSFVGCWLLVVCFSIG